MDQISLMKHQEQRDASLHEVPTETLIRLLRGVDQNYQEFTVRIDAAALASDPGALEAFLIEHMDALPRPDGWLPDNEGEAYTDKVLDPIVEAVHDDLLPVAPAAAARVLCHLLTLDEEILQRVDNSYACVGVLVCWITDILVEAVKVAPDETLAALRAIQMHHEPMLWRKETLTKVADALRPA